MAKKIQSKVCSDTFMLKSSVRQHTQSTAAARQSCENVGSIMDCLAVATIQSLTYPALPKSGGIFRCRQV